MNKLDILNKDILSDRIDEFIKLSIPKEKHTVLLVDDEINNLQLLKRTLRSSYNILEATNGSEALKIVEEKGDKISLIVSDQRMPEMTGTEFLQKTDEKYPNIVKILLTGNLDTDIIVDSINDCHLFQYILKPFEPEELKKTVQNGVEKYTMTENKEIILEELKDLFFRTIKSISSALDAKDAYTKGHAERVTIYSVILAEAMGLSKTELAQIKMAGLLHDIGKIAIPLKILCKPGKLDDSEFSVIKSHAEKGEQIVKKIKKLTNVAQWLKNHHERWDGFGYPSRLKGEEIPLFARIIAIADTYDAMTSTRSYRTELSADVAFEEIKRCKGSQFDPNLVEVFLKVRDKVESVKGNVDKYFEHYEYLNQYFE